MTATAETPATDERIDAIGTRLRLRALGAIGHSDARMARALGVPRWVVTRIITRTAQTVTPQLRADCCQLFDAWWDKVPPERTRAERAAAKAARERAQRGRWTTGMGLDENEIDTPGYRPQSTWRLATGTGVADDDPLGREAAQ